MQIIVLCRAGVDTGLRDALPGCARCNHIKSGVDMDEAHAARQLGLRIVLQEDDITFLFVDHPGDVGVVAVGPPPQVHNTEDILAVWAGWSPISSSQRPHVAGARAGPVTRVIYRPLRLLKVKKRRTSLANIVGGKARTEKQESVEACQCPSAREKKPEQGHIVVFPSLADVVEVKTGSRSPVHWRIHIIRPNSWLRRSFAQLIILLDIDGIGQIWEVSNRKTPEEAKGNGA